MDALELPAAELRARRYANYEMEPNKWTFQELLAAYFFSTCPIYDESEKFYEDAGKPEAIDVLKRRLDEVERAIPFGTGE